MEIGRIRRRWKILVTGILAIACILVAFNIWFIQNTNTIIEDIVQTASGGKLKLELRKSRFHYLSKRILLQGAHFYSTDTADANTLYEFTIPKFDLKVRSVWAFLWRNELLIDSIVLNAPQVTVTRIAKSEKNVDSAGGREVSIPEAAGRVYNSIQAALQVLQVKRFQMDEGIFNLVNKFDADKPITTISNIHFHINNLKISDDTAAAAEKFLYSDDIALRIHNQEIAFPDGVHRMKFKNLALNVANREMLLDSCLLIAESRETRNNMSFYFTGLKLANIDFNALYQQNLIKADSVSISKPHINIAFERKAKTTRSNKLELDSIIQNLTGDLMLGYIGVQGAKVDIVAYRGDTATTYRSENDNFSMYDLRIKSDSSVPVYVDAFAMTLRDYETYSRDSSNLYRFDSVRFANNRIRLSNFSIETIRKRPGRAALYYNAPLFELTGLSWPDLLFDRSVTAEKALLVQPEIVYNLTNTKRKQKGQKTSIFELLSGLNETVSLREVEIQNGNVTVRLPDAKSLSLRQVNLKLASNALLASKSYTGMQQAINNLAFRNAIFQTRDMRAELTNLRYANRLLADQLTIVNNAGTLQARASGISLDDLVWNNDDKSIYVENLGWQQGNVVLRRNGASKKVAKSRSSIIVNGLNGNNTRVHIILSNGQLQTVLEDLKAERLVKIESEPLYLDQLATKGRLLEYTKPGFTLRAGAFTIADGTQSSIKDLQITASSQTAMQVRVGETFLKPHVAELMRGRYDFDNIELVQPLFMLQKNKRIDSLAIAPKSTGAFPVLNVSNITLTRPVFYFGTDSSANSFRWADTVIKSDDNNWHITQLRTTPAGTITADAIAFKGSSFIYRQGSSRYGIDSGSIGLQLNQFYFDTKKKNSFGTLLQSALFQNPMPFITKKGDTVAVQQLRVNGAGFAAADLQDVAALLKKNEKLRLSFAGGSMRGSKTLLQWQEGSYEPSRQLLQVDSFQFRPRATREEAIAAAPGQIDYIQGLLKNLQAKGFDLNKWMKDTVFNASNIAVSGADISIYRDKGKPFISPGKRALPVEALQGIPFPLQIDSISIDSSRLLYTEVPAKRNMEGNILLENMSATIGPLRSRDVDSTDTLQVHMQARLLNAANLGLQLDMPYVDSSKQFAMKLQLGNMYLPDFNPVLLPLVSARVRSGRLDSLQLSAVADSFSSKGTMHMAYRNLQVQLVKNGDPNKHTFLTRAVTFLANRFVLRRNNRNREGLVYFERLQDRSVFNYIIKTTISGITTSVGVKKNKKVAKKIKAAEQKRGEPAKP